MAKIISTPMQDFKNKVKKHFEKMFDYIKEQYGDSVPGLLCTSALNTAITFAFGYIAGGGLDHQAANLGEAVVFRGLAAGAVIFNFSYNACAIAALGVAIKDKLTKGKIDLQTGLSEKIGDDELAQKLSKMLKNISEDKPLFKDFMEKIDLNKDDKEALIKLVKRGEDIVALKNEAQMIAPTERVFGAKFGLF